MIMVAMSGSLTLCVIFAALNVLEAFDFGSYEPLAKSVDMEIQHRSKRAVGPLPTLLNFSMSPTKDLPSLRRGEKLPFQIDIQFPSGVSDISVEIFAPNVSMMLCDIDVKIGNRLQFNGTTFSAQDILNSASFTGTQDTLSSWPITWAKIIFPKVTHNATGGSVELTDITASILFNAVMLNADVSQTYYINTGVEYSNDSEIWVCQSSINASKVIGTFQSNQFNMSGDRYLYPGLVSTYNLNLYLPSDVTSFSVELYSPLNDVTLVSTCQIGFKNAGRGYACRPKSQWSTNYVNYKQYYFHEGYFKTYNNFADLVNSYSYDPATLDDHRITLQLYVLTNKTAQIGKSSYIRVNVNNSANTNMWTSDFPVTVTNPPNVTNSSLGNLTPLLMVKKVGTTSLNLNTATSFSVEIDIPEYTISDYELQILMPSSNVTNQSYVQISKVEIVSVGKNLPCLDQRIKSITPEYKSLYNDSGLLTYSDFVSLKFSNVLNSGMESTISNPNTNKIIVKCYVKMSNVSLNTPSLSVYASVGLFYDSRHCVSLFDLTLNNIGPDYDNSSVNFSLNFPPTGGNLYSNAVKQMNFIVYSNPGSTYLPMNFEIILPNSNNVNLFAICKVWVISVGKNLDCVDPVAINFSIQKNATVDLIDKVTYPDKISGSIGSICNSGAKDYMPTDDDKLVIGIQIKYINNSISSGNNFSITAGTLFSDTQLWVCQLGVTTCSDSQLILAPGSYPKANLMLINTVAPNQIAIFNLVLKLAPYSEAFYSFTVSSQSTVGQSSICYVKAVRVGKNIPCFDGSDVKVLNSSNFITGNTMLRQSLTVSLGFKSNTGNDTLYDDTRFDDSSIVLEVAVKVGTDVSGTFNLTGKVTFNNGEVPVSVSTTVDTNSTINMTTLKNDSLPTFSLYKVPIFSNASNTSTVFPGEVFRALLDITLMDNSIQSIVVKFSTPVNETNVFDISNVNLVSVGSNVFCLHRGYPQSVASRRNGSSTQDTLTIDLGVVCHQSIYPAASGSNVIQVEVIGRFWSYSSKNPGTSFLLSAIVNINSDRINVVQLMMNVVNANVSFLENFPNENFTAVLNLSSTNVRIGGTVNATLSLTIPREIYGQCYIDFRSPTQASSTSELFDLIDMKILKSGRNLGLIHNEPFSVNFLSTRNNTQNDKGSIAPLACFNTGVTYRMNQYGPDDNVLTISYLFRVTDNQNMENGSVRAASFGVQYGSYIVIANNDVTILRDVTDKAVFNCTTVILGNKASYQKNDEIDLSTQCQLANTSTAEPQNVTFQYYLPPYLTFVNNSLKPETYVKGQLNSAPSDSVIQIKMSGPLLFGDRVNFQFKIKVQETNKSNSIAVTPWEVAYEIYKMPNNPLSGLKLKESSFLKFSVTGSQQQTSVCFDKFGMDNSNIIKDCAIFAFMSPFIGNEAIQARPSAAGWIPHVRNQDFNLLRYITVLFGTMKDVNKIEVYSFLSKSRVLEIDIHRTFDGRAFVPAVSALSLTYNESTYVASAVIPGQLRARGIRIVITKTSNDSDQTPFRFELFGCASSNVSVLSSDFEPCSRRGYDEPTEDQIPKEHYHRGYLYNSNLNTLYYCDTVITDKERLKYEPRCFRANTAGQFEVLGRNVGSIIGIATYDNTLFGVSADRRGYVSSVDNGYTWSMINQAAWEAAKSTLGSNNLLTAINLPWIVNTTFNVYDTGSSCQVYQNDWKFCFDGIYVNSQQMVKWNSCCSL